MFDFLKFFSSSILLSVDFKLMMLNSASIKAKFLNEAKPLSHTWLTILSITLSQTLTASEFVFAFSCFIKSAFVQHPWFSPQMPDAYNNSSKTILFTTVSLKLYFEQDAKNVLAIPQIYFKSYSYMGIFEFRIMLGIRKKTIILKTENLSN